MWSFYHDKKHQVWLWWAVDHKTNTPLAYTFGTREYKYLDELLKLLSEFHIGMVYADNTRCNNRYCAVSVTTSMIIFVLTIWANL